MARKGRVYLPRLLPAVSDDRVPDIDPENGASAGIVFKHSADIEIKKRNVLFASGEDIETLWSSSNFGHDFVLIEPDQPRPNLSEDAEFVFS